MGTRAIEEFVNSDRWKMLGGARQAIFLFEDQCSDVLTVVLIDAQTGTVQTQIQLLEHWRHAGSKGALLAHTIDVMFKRTEMAEATKAREKDR